MTPPAADPRALPPDRRPRDGGAPVLATPWFEIHARPVVGGAEPHYAIWAPDVAVVVAVNAQGHLLLVRQYRPPVDMVTLEIPSGHIEPGETPEEAARKELREETGWHAPTLELLGCMSPSAGRFMNRYWVFFAPDVQPPGPGDDGPEPGLTAEWYSGPFAELLEIPAFVSATNHAALFAAIARGRLSPRGGLPDGPPPGACTEPMNPL